MRMLPLALIKRCLSLQRWRWMQRPGAAQSVVNKWLQCSAFMLCTIRLRKHPRKEVRKKCESWKAVRRAKKPSSCRQDITAAILNSQLLWLALLGLCRTDPVNSQSYMRRIHRILLLPAKLLVLNHSRRGRVIFTCDLNQPGSSLRSTG